MKSPVRNEQLFDKRVAFSLVFTIQKRENKSWGEKMASKNEMLVFLSLFLECKPALRPCLWEVVLSGFVVANHQVSLNLSHVEGMERALLCAKKNAVTEFNLSLVESFEGNETEDFKSPWEKCRDRKRELWVLFSMLLSPELESPSVTFSCVEFNVLFFSFYSVTWKKSLSLFLMN